MASSISRMRLTYGGGTGAVEADTVGSVDVVAAAVVEGATLAGADDTIGTSAAGAEIVGRGTAPQPATRPATTTQRRFMSSSVAGRGNRSKASAVNLGEQEDCPMPSGRIAAGATAAAALLLAAGCSKSSGKVDTAQAPATAPSTTAGPSATPAGATPAAPTTSSGSAATQPAAPTGSAVTLVGDVPDVEVVDVATGAKVRLRSLFPGDKPVLLWFWAPH